MFRKLFIKNVILLYLLILWKCYTIIFIDSLKMLYYYIYWFFDKINYKIIYKNSFILKF
jgi:hypothetical protein